MTTAKWKTDLRQLCINETIKQKNFIWSDTIYTAVTPHMGIDKCRLEFLLSLKVVMLKRLEFHKEELYATLPQLMPLSEIRLLPAERMLTQNSQAFKKNISKDMCLVYLQCLETQKKTSSALELQIRSQQNYTMNRSCDNLFKGVSLEVLQAVTLTHGICITKAAPEQTLIHGESGLRKYSAILAPMESSSRKESQSSKGEASTMTA